MLDIETAGSEPGSAILSIGACYFGDDGVGDTFYRPVQLFSSLMAGLTVTTDALAWWRRQSPQVIAATQPLQGVVTLAEALDSFAAFIDGAAALWAKGPDFDCVVLGAAYRALGERQPWTFSHTRDVRTIMALAGPVECPRRDGAMEHHALSDAIEQADIVRACCSKIGRRIDSLQ